VANTSFLTSSYVIKFYINSDLSHTIVQDIIRDFLDNIVNSISSSVIFYLESESIDRNILNEIQNN